MTAREARNALANVLNASDEVMYANPDEWLMHPSLSTKLTGSDDEFIIVVIKVT